MPWASTVLSPMSFFSRYDPIVPAPAPWMHATTSRSRLAARLYRWLTERLTQEWADPVRRFRKLRGLPPGGNPIMDGQHSPYLVLGLFSRVLGDPQPDWPDRVVVTGASFYNGPGAPELPEALDDFIEAGTPALVFTLGTSAVVSAGSFYDVSAEVARSLGRRAVLLAGRHAENRPSVSHADIFVADFARHDALFPRAAAIIHQGGAGTLHQGLRSGSPMLVVPHAHDQPDNASRVERLGVARSLKPSHYRAERVQRHLASLLDEPAYRERAETVAHLVKAEPGAEGAARAIENLLD